MELIGSKTRSIFFFWHVFCQERRNTRFACTCPGNMAAQIPTRPTPAPFYISSPKPARAAINEEHAPDMRRYSIYLLFGSARVPVPSLLSVHFVMYCRWRDSFLYFLVCICVKVHNFISQSICFKRHHRRNNWCSDWVSRHCLDTSCFECISARGAHDNARTQANQCTISILHICVHVDRKGVLHVQYSAHTQTPASLQTQSMCACCGAQLARRLCACSSSAARGAPGHPSANSRGGREWYRHASVPMMGELLVVG